MKPWSFVGGLSASTALVALVASPAIAQARSFNVPAQSAVSAIPELARQADVQILVSEGAARGRQTKAVIGTMPVDEAVRRMLRGTGLAIQSNDGRTITLARTGAPGESRSNRVPGTHPAAADRGPSDAAVEPVQTGGESVSLASAPVETSEPTEIVVTGSRLQASGFSAPTPTSVLNKDVIDDRAPTGIADVVNRLPSVRLSSGPQQATRSFGNGIGQATIDLRGLGAVRTLTLIDGNRFTPTAETGTVDSGIIPVSLVERVDVVTGGASAAYGSDAVAGVVNYVLRHKLEGIRASAQYGVTQYGDAQERVFSLGFGTSFADGRGHFIAGGDYANNQGVGNLTNRDWGAGRPGLVPNGTPRAANVPFQSFSRDVTFSAQTVGGLITAGPLRGVAFGPGGTPYAFQYGQIFSTLMVGGSNPLGNPNDNPSILSPNSRRAALARVEYAITDNVTAFAEANYGYTDIDTYSGFYQASVTIGVNNPFLPAQTRADMIRLGQSTITVGRLLAEYGGLRVNQIHRTYRGIGGLQGKLGDFTWDASVQYGKTKHLYNIGDLAVANFLAAVNVVTGPDGQPACGPVATNPNLQGTNAYRQTAVQSGCVPFNIFGFGSPSAASIDYVTGRGGPRRRTENDRVNAAINLRGSPFSTWAGPLQLAIGGEYRRDTLRSFTDPLASVIGWASVNGQAYFGAVSVKEGYAELGVPLARDMTLLQALDLNAAIRRTDYSTSGGVTTWKVGGTWEPVTGLRFRATRSRDIRAANLNELYNKIGTSDGGTIINPFNGASGRFSAITAGNPDLVPEKAKTTTFGGVLQPAAARWLNASVDYYRISIKDAITQLSARDVLTRCFQTRAPVYCSNVGFDNSAFGIATITGKPFNATSFLTRGIDFAVTGNFDLGAAGKLGARALATHVIDLVSAGVERAGSLQASGTPSWSGTFDLTYSKAAFRTTLSARYFSRSKFDAALVGPEDAAYDPTSASSININRFPSETYFDLYAEYTFNAGSRTPVTLFGSVQNLADKDPPLFAVTGVTTGGNPYDQLGRRFRVGFRLTH